MVTRRIFDIDEAREIEAIAIEEIDEMIDQQDKVARNLFAATASGVVAGGIAGLRGKIVSNVKATGIPLTIFGLIRRVIFEEFEAVGGSFDAALRTKGVAGLTAQNPEFKELLTLAKTITPGRNKATLIKSILDLQKFGDSGIAAIASAVNAFFQGRDVASAAQRAFFDANPWVAPPELIQEFTELHEDQKRRLKEVPVASGIIGG